MAEDCHCELSGTVETDRGQVFLGGYGIILLIFDRGNLDDTNGLVGNVISRKRGRDIDRSRNENFLYKNPAHLEEKSHHDRLEFLHARSNGCVDIHVCRYFQTICIVRLNKR